MPTNIEAEIARDLLDRLKKQLGYLPQVEQVDIGDIKGDPIERGPFSGDMYAHIWWGKGDDDYTMLDFFRPELIFESAEIEREMVCRTIPIDPDLLAKEVLKRVRRMKHRSGGD
jgi:hypothetical protein